MENAQGFFFFFARIFRETIFQLSGSFRAHERSETLKKLPGHQFPFLLLLLFLFFFCVFIKEESQYQRYDRPITLMDQRRILRPCSAVL